MSLLDKKYVLTINLEDSTITYPLNMSFFNTDKNIANLYVKVQYRDDVIKYISKTDAVNYNIKLTVIKPKSNNLKEVQGVITNDFEEDYAIYKFELPSEFTDQVGLVVCEFLITNENEILTTSSFSYTIKASKVTGLNPEIILNPDLPVLKQLIEDVKSAQQWISNIDDKNVSEVKTYSNKKIEDIKAKVDEQFISIDNKIGEVATTGTTTEAVQNKVSEMSKQGLIQAYTLANETVTREKNNYYVIDDTNLITKNGYKLIHGKYYSPSNGVSNREGYSYYHMIPLFPNTTYYTLASDIVLFNSSQTKTRVITGNLGATLSFTTTSEEVFLCLNYGATPTFIQPGTNGYFLSMKNGTQTRKIYDNELKIKDNNFSDYNKSYSELVSDIAKLSVTNGKDIPCNMINSYKNIYDFSNIETSNIEIKKSNKNHISKESIYAVSTNNGTCTIKKILDVPITKEEFESISTSLYIPWETLDSTSVTGAYIQMYFNDDSVNSSTGLNGRVFAGWNIVKIDKNEFNIDRLPNTITSITYKIIPRNNVVTGAKFGEFYFDSIIINMRMKPTVIISFDQIWQESIDNGAFDLMYNKGLPYSMYTEYSSLTQNQINVINKHKNLCEFSLYGSISRNVPVSTIQTELNNAINTGEDVVKQPFNTYAVSQTIITDKDVCALKRTNIKLARLIQDSIPIGYFDSNSNIQCISVSIDQKTATFTKAIIDRAIKYGSVASLFLHGVRNDGNESTSISGKGMDLTEFTNVINYIKQLRDAGTINVMTYGEFVENCLGN